MARWKFPGSPCTPLQIAALTLLYHEHAAVRVAVTGESWMPVKGALERCNAL